MDYVSEVERLFAEAPDQFEEYRRNPVTGGGFHGRLDSIEEQKRAAHRALRTRDRALRARSWFQLTGPKDAPPLPLSYDEREDLKRGGHPLRHIEAWFAFSLENRDYAFDEHPSFDDFARGVLASPKAPDFIKQDQELRDRYPPRALPGLNHNGLYWEPVELPW